MKRTGIELDSAINKIFETDYYRGKFKQIVQNANSECPLCDGWGWGQDLSSVLDNSKQPVIRFCVCLQDQVNKITGELNERY